MPGSSPPRRATRSQPKTATRPSRPRTLKEKCAGLEKENRKVGVELARLSHKATLAEAMLEATGRINSSLSFSEVIRGILDSTKHLLRVRRSCLFLVDHEHNVLRVAGSRGLSVKTIEQLRFKPGQGVAGNVWVTGKPALIPDVRHDPVFVARPGHRTPRETMASFPLNTGESIVGVLSVDRPLSLGLFTQEEQAYLSFLADHAAVALKNVQLHEGISRRASQLSTLYEVGSALVSVLNADRLLNKIVDGVIRVTGASHCSLMMIDERTKKLRVRVAQGMPPAVMKRIRVPMGEGISGHVAQTGKPMLIEDIETHPLFKRKSQRQYSSRSCLCVPLEYRGRVIGVLNASNKRPPGAVFTEDDQNLLTLFASQAAVTIENANLYRNLKLLATTDSLTGLSVRRHFRAIMKTEVQRARRFRRPLSVIMLDIDDFKLVNDRYGHPVGDHVLRVLSRLLRTRGARDHDIVARYGGEEFVIGSLEADKRIAISIADRLRQSVEQQNLGGTRKTAMRVTISLGVASFPEDAETLDDLVEQADRALYHAKRSGKNQVGYLNTEGVLSLVGDRTRKR